MRASVLVMAKAPVPGRVKTRLAATEGPQRAADLALAALLDTLDTCCSVFPSGRRFVALAGEVDEVGPAEELRRGLEAWTVLAQRGTTFGERLARAHADVHARSAGPVVQIGMDTPHVTTHDLVAVAATAAATGLPVLGPAADGGWWVLASTRADDVSGLEAVAMSTPGTGAATRDLLLRNAGSVLDGPTLRDVDDAADALASTGTAPETRFASLWHAGPRQRGGGS